MQNGNFGVMLDCSRNAVMKPEAVKKMIDCLEIMGYNMLQLYTEDTYEVEGEPYFGYLRGRYTSAELQEIDSYAAAHGVELIPCIQTLAHFGAPSKIPNLNYLWDFDDILLCGEKKTYEFIDKLFASAAKNFRSRKINIGMDEAHMMGLGKYLEKHGYKKRKEIFLDHLKKVAAIADKYGFTAHMWSDMFYRELNGGEYYGENREVPLEVMDEIPQNIEIIYWDYYHYDEQTYDSMIESHKKFNRNIWFAGGIWGWYGFTPYNTLTKLRMKPAMKSVVKNNIKNVFMTMWGDGGKECSFFALLPMLYTVRRYADGEFDDSVIAAEFEKLFKLSYDDFMLLELPNFPDQKSLEGCLYNSAKLLLYNDCFLGLYDKELEKVGRFPFSKYRVEIAAAEKRAGEYGYIFKAIASLCAVLEYKAELGLRTRKAYSKGDKEGLAALQADYEEVIVRLNVFYKDFYELWMRENKPFGWEVQDIRLGGLILRIESCKNRLKQYLSGEISKIDELEEEILPYGSDSLFQSKYTLIVSPGNL